MHREPGEHPYLLSRVRDEFRRVNDYQFYCRTGALLAGLLSYANSERFRLRRPGSCIDVYLSLLQIVMGPKGLTGKSRLLSHQSFP